MGCLILYFCLLSQVPRSPVEATREEADDARPLVDVERRKPKLTPPRLVTEALTPPDENLLAGRRVSLLDVLMRSNTRSAQLAAVQAYWTLSTAVGEYYFCQREREALAALAASSSAPRAEADKRQSPALTAEVALAAARMREAEVRTAAAQVELAERAGLSAAEALPLPVDEPHVGPYRTTFEVLFASRPAPPRLQLLQQTLPLRQKSIDVRAQAVQAALDALEAAQEAYERRDIDAEVVASRIVHLGRQRKAFLESVRQYNHDIAEYALAVANPALPPAALLPLLIKPKAAEPATPSGTPANSNSASESTPRGNWREVSPRTRIGRPAMRSLLKPDFNDATAQGRLQPPASTDEVAQLETPDEQSADYESYAALLDLSAPKRTHRLARLLHWDRALAHSETPSLSLEECLAKAPPGARRRAVTAFWNAREQAARCQVFSDQNDQLAVLLPLVLRHARQPGGAEAMLDLRARQQASEADWLEAQARLFERRLELAAAVGRDASSKDWPLPSTTPHGGRYEMKLESQPRHLVQSSAVRSVAATLPGLYAALEDRAEAIIHLDSQRAAALEELPGAARWLDLSEPLDSIDRQATESLAFLSTLTRYNLAIGEYAISILPPASNAVELTSAMVVPAKE